MDMPSYTGYGDILGMNPYAQVQANQQMDLARQFQNQKYQQEQNTTQKGTLENTQSTAMNPLLLEQQRSVNLGQDYKNVVSSNTAEASTANQLNVLSKQQRQAALDASEDEIKQFDLHVQKMLTSPTEAVRDQGATMQQYLSSFQTERRKAKDDMEKQREVSRSHIEGARIQAQGQRDVAGMNIDAGRFKDHRGAGGGVSIVARLSSGKMKVPERLGTVGAMLKAGVNIDTQQTLSDMERTYLQALYDQDAATKEGDMFLKAQGIVPRVATGGGIDLVNKPVPSVRPPAATPNKPALPSGWAQTN